MPVIIQSVEAIETAAPRPDQPPAPPAQPRPQPSTLTTLEACLRREATRRARVRAH